VRNGGRVDDDTVTIAVQKPQTVVLEQAYVDHYPVEKRVLSHSSGVVRTVLDDRYSVEFEGVGFVLMGRADKLGEEDYVFQAKVLVDGQEVETTSWPTDMNIRRFHLAWKFELTRGKHKIEVQLLNPSDKATVVLENLVVYDNQPPSAKY
jgi:hypothetical protein